MLGNPVYSTLITHGLVNSELCRNMRTWSTEVSETYEKNNFSIIGINFGNLISRKFSVVAKVLQSSCSSKT
jgi:hypothetical protein